jgi:hypothetical protein
VSWRLVEDGVDVVCLPGDTVSVRVDSDQMIADFPCSDEGGVTPPVEGGVAFEVEAQGKVAAGLDGEALVLDPPLRFRVRPAALRCRIARHHPGASPAALTPERAWGAITALVGIAAGHDPRPMPRR